MMTSRSEPCRCRLCSPLLGKPMLGCACWCHLPGAQRCGVPHPDQPTTSCTLPKTHRLAEAVVIHNDGHTQWSRGLIDDRRTIFDCAGCDGSGWKPVSALRPSSQGWAVCTRCNADGSKPMPEPSPRARVHGLPMGAIPPGCLVVDLPAPAPPPWASDLPVRIDVGLPCSDCAPGRVCWGVDNRNMCEVLRVKLLARAREINRRIQESFRRDVASIERQMLEQVRREVAELGIDLDSEPAPCPHCGTLHD